MSYKDHIYSALAKPALQPLIDRCIGYALRLKGFNNYPPGSGELGPFGERWFIEHFLSRAAVCLDIGGNRGEFALTLLELTPATVYCVEPNPLMALTASERTSKFAGRAAVIQKAVSNTKGTAVLRINPDQAETATLSDAVNAHAYPGQEQVTVETTTIDELVEELGIARLDFMKIDVEGLELACLEGARHTLATLRPAFVQVEFHWHHMFTGTTVFAMAELLPEYRPYRLLPRGLATVNPRSTLDNIFAYSNLIFSRALL